MDPRTVWGQPIKQGLKKSSQDLHSWISQPGPQHSHAWRLVSSGTAEGRGPRHRETTRNM